MATCSHVYYCIACDARGKTCTEGASFIYIQQQQLVVYLDHYHYHCHCHYVRLHFLIIIMLYTETTSALPLPLCKIISMLIFYTIIATTGVLIPESSSASSNSKTKYNVPSSLFMHSLSKEKK